MKTTEPIPQSAPLEDSSKPKDVIDFPRATERWGTPSALAAFIFNRAMDGNTTAAEVDAAIDRVQGHASAGNDLSRWLLSNGLHADFYNKPTHPIEAELDLTDFSQLTFDEYFEIYKKYFSVSEDDQNSAGYMEAFEAYFYEKIRPSRLNKEPELKQDFPGQVTSRQLTPEDYTPKAIYALLPTGSYMYTSSNGSGLHACLYKVDEDGTEVVRAFMPRHDGTYADQPLFIGGGRAYDQKLYNDLISPSTSLGVWRRP